MTEKWPKTFAWTPGQGAYKYYPQYVNVRAYPGGGGSVTVRGLERLTGLHPEMGETICIELPPTTFTELSAFLASAIEARRVETEGLDAQHESAAPKGDAQ